MRAHGICTLVFLFCSELFGMGRRPGGIGASGPRGRRGLRVDAGPGLDGWSGP